MLGDFAVRCFEVAGWFVVREWESRGLGGLEEGGRFGWGGSVRRVVVMVLGFLMRRAVMEFGFDWEV